MSSKRNIMYATIVVLALLILTCVSPAHAGASIEVDVKSSSIHNRFYTFHLEEGAGLIFEDRKTGCQYWFIDAGIPVVNLGCKFPAKFYDVTDITAQENKVKEFQNKDRN